MQSIQPRRRKSISYAKYGYLFILPFFVVYCFFMLYPLINTFVLSFYGNGRANADLNVGFQNFQYLLAGGSRPAKAIHEEFVNALKNTVILWFGNFIPQICLSLLLAVWFTDSKLKIKGQGFFKVVMYMPNIITATSVCALFLSILGNTKYGAVNSFLLHNNMISEAINFVTGTTSSRVIVMFIQTWMWFGNTMILLMSGIMGINPSLFEAASIDGANSGQIFFRITLPVLRPIFIYVLITSMIGGLQMFDIPYLFHEDANTIRPSLETVAVFIYKSFHATDPNYGYSAAASVILFFITGILGSVTFAMNNSTQDKKKNKIDRKAAKARKQLGGF